jgi:hypothetical protein
MRNYDRNTGIPHYELWPEYSNHTFWIVTGILKFHILNCDRNTQITHSKWWQEYSNHTFWIVTPILQSPSALWQEYSNHTFWIVTGILKSHILNCSRNIGIPHSKLWEEYSNLTFSTVRGTLKSTFEKIPIVPWDDRWFMLRPFNNIPLGENDR